MPDPAGAHQQTVPPSGPGEPHRLLLPTQRHGAQWEQEMGQPAEEGDRHPAQAKGTIIHQNVGLMDEMF